MLEPQVPTLCKQCNAALLLLLSVYLCTYLYLLDLGVYKPHGSWSS